MKIFNTGIDRYPDDIWTVRIWTVKFPGDIWTVEIWTVKIGLGLRLGLGLVMTVQFFTVHILRQVTVYRPADVG